MDGRLIPKYDENYPGHPKFDEIPRKFIFHDKMSNASGEHLQCSGGAEVQVAGARPRIEAESLVKEVFSASPGRCAGMILSIWELRGSSSTKTISDMF